MNDENNGKVFVNVIKNSFVCSALVIILLICGSLLFSYFKTKSNSNVTDSVKSFKYSIKDIHIKQLEDLHNYNTILLKDGNVLFSGKKNIQNGKTTDKAYVYDPQKNIIIKDIHIKQLEDLHNYNMILLKDGNVLFSGGKNIQKRKATDKAYVYDPQKNIIIKESKMNKARFSHRSLLLSNGNVLIFGPYYDIEVYDTLKNEFHYIVTTSNFAPDYAIETDNPNEILLINSLKYTQLLNIKQKTISKLNLIGDDDPYYLSYPIKIKDSLYFFPRIFNKEKNIIYKLNLKTYKIEKIVTTIDLPERNSIEIDTKPIKINNNEILFYGAVMDDAYVHTSNIISYNIKTNSLNIKSTLLSKRGSTSLEGKTLPIDEDNILIYGGSVIYSHPIFGCWADMCFKSVRTCEIYNVNKNKIIAKNNNNIGFRNNTYFKIRDKKFLMFNRFNNKIKLLEFE